MSKLEQIDLLATPDPRVIDAINSIDTLGNSTQETSRRHDLAVLAGAGRLFGTTRVCFATGNALVMSLLEQMPDHVEAIEFHRPQIRDAVIGLFPEYESRVSDIKAQGKAGPTALVVDVMDIVDHAETIRAELLSGDTQELWVHSSLLSYARIWLEHAAHAAVDQLPFSRGFTVLQLNQAQCQALADALDACVLESCWFPSRIHEYFHGSPVGNTRTIDKVFRSLGLSGKDDDAALCRLCHRAVDLLTQIHDAIADAIPGVHHDHMPDSVVFKSNAKLDLTAVCRSIERYFLEHPRQDLLVAMLADNHQAVTELARSLRETGSELRSPARIRSLAKLLRILFQVREQTWWMRDWGAPNNQTWRILLEGRCPAGALGPKPVKPLEEYLNLYWYEGARNAEQMRRRKNPPVRDPENRPSSRRILTLGHLNHTARKLQASQLCSLLLYRLGAQYPHETIRWLDVGCGNGNIANSVHIPDWLEDRIEIIGLDFGEGMIANANDRAAKNRRYIVADALTPPDEIMGMRFHLVSTFEFLEHLIDPVELLRNYATLKPEVMVGGSPLGEPQPWLPTRAHTWSFKREGYEALFQEAGMKVTYSSEVRIGSYLGGHDWITVAGAFGQGILPELPREVVNTLTKLETVEEFKPNRAEPALR